MLNGTWTKSCSSAWSPTSHSCLSMSHLLRPWQREWRWVLLKLSLGVYDTDGMVMSGRGGRGRPCVEKWMWKGVPEPSENGLLLRSREELWLCGTLSPPVPRREVLADLFSSSSRGRWKRRSAKEEGRKEGGKKERRKKERKKKERKQGERKQNIKLGLPLQHNFSSISIKFIQKTRLDLFIQKYLLYIRDYARNCKNINKVWYCVFQESQGFFC